MSSELLKKIAAGEAFDLVEGVREIARVLTEKPLSNSPQLGERTGSGRATVTLEPSNGTGKE